MKQKSSLITVGDILTIVTSRRIVKTNTARDYDMEGSRRTPFSFIFLFFLISSQTHTHYRTVHEIWVPCKWIYMVYGERAGWGCMYTKGKNSEALFMT